MKRSLPQGLETEAGDVSVFGGKSIFQEAGLMVEMAVMGEMLSFDLAKSCTP